MTWLKQPPPRPSGGARSLPRAAGFQREAGLPRRVGRKSSGASAGSSLWEADAEEEEEEEL